MKNLSYIKELLYNRLGSSEIFSMMLNYRGGMVEKLT